MLEAEAGDELYMHLCSLWHTFEFCCGASSHSKIYVRFKVCKSGHFAGVMSMCEHVQYCMLIWLRTWGGQTWSIGSPSCRLQFRQRESWVREPQGKKVSLMKCTA